MIKRKKRMAHEAELMEIAPDLFIQCLHCADIAVDLRIRERMPDGKNGITVVDTYFHQRCFNLRHPDPKKFAAMFTKLSVRRLSDETNKEETANGS